MPDTVSDLSIVVPSRRAGPILLSAFALSLFASAFLLFSVQPLVSRLVLPRLGGSPAVWNTCVCFFQAALLLGYGYAHLASTRLQPRAQVMLHMVLLTSAMVMMPLSLGAAAPPADASPIGWLFSLLTLTVGLPFVAIAATAPLMQTWFSRTTHPHARDPYFLYAASNAGSLVALLSYPVLIETTLGLPDQLLLWSAGLVITAAAVLACGLAALLRSAASVTMPLTQTRAIPVAVGERLRWVVLAFVPSALMLAVTTHITTDVAAVPLFWVVPLAIYILTFVLAFAERSPLNRRAMLVLQGIALAAAGTISLEGTRNMAAMLIPLVAFALTAVVCHTELASRRPDVQHLTGYFFLISVGGALGGLFNALLAPMLFPVPLEYPLLLIAACLLRPAAARLSTQTRENWATRGDLLLPSALILMGMMLFWGSSPEGPELLRPVFRVASVAVPGLVLLWFAGRRTRLALGLAICLAVPILVEALGTQATGRDFFGVLRVKELPGDDLVVMQHGTTVHGVQGTRAGEEHEPLSYFRRNGPFGRAFAIIAQRPVPIATIGVIGLGTGALGCYARPGESWTFYEIDPMVERFARDGRWFKFMSGCGNHPTVVLGDARVNLSANPAAQYDVLILDAFSSDSVPMHLITREALALYFARLKPGGILLFNITNRYLDLPAVVARIASEAGMPMRHLHVPAGDDILRQPRVEGLAMAAPGGNLDAFAADGWDEVTPGPVLWTDERSDIFGVIRWR